MESLIREYLDCEYQGIERLSEVDSAYASKSKKQLFGIAKPFGSIGKSVSRKILSMGREKRPKSPMGESILCVKIKVRRHEYVDQMLQNYMDCAHTRFVQEQPVEEAKGEYNYGAGKSRFYTGCDNKVSYEEKSINPHKDPTLYLSRFVFRVDEKLYLS